MTTANTSSGSHLSNAASVGPTTSASARNRQSHSVDSSRGPHVAPKQFGVAVKTGTGGAPDEVPLDAQLLQVVTTTGDQATTDQMLRSIAIKATGAVGAAHLVRENELWTIRAAQTTGRVASQESLTQQCGDQFQEFVQSKSPSLVQLTGLDNLPAVFLSAGTQAQPELFMVVLKDSTNLTNTFSKLHKVVAALRLVRRQWTLNRSQWELNALAAIMELIGKVEQSDTVKSATEMLTNELVSLLNCDSVAVALRKKRKLTLQAISGIDKIDRASRTCRDYQQALYESIVRDQQGTFPSADADNGHLLLAHKQLVSTVHSQAAISQPLKVADNDAIGSWIFTGSQSQIAAEHFGRFVDTATPHLSAALELLQRSEKGWIKRSWQLLNRKTKLFTRLMIPISLVAFYLLMLVPITYKVRCNCTVEPVLRRFAVAAFDGLVESGFVEPGDLVEKDQVLAEIDGRTIRWELLGVSSQRKQSLRQREIELAQRNIPETLLAELENRRLTAEEEVLKYKQEHLKIRSPIAGVVLSGSLERAEAASVKTGQVLFEIGPIDPVKIEIAIAADEASQVKKGHPVTVWIEGQEDRPLKSVIQRIQPRSEIRDAKNVFVAEIKFDNPGQTLRPGMKGVVRIDAEKRSLGWSLFHKPINYLRSRLTWW